MRTGSLAQAAAERAAPSFPRRGVDVFVPSGAGLERAARGVDSLGVAAHPDDLECMALGPIQRGGRARRPAFAGVVVCSGSGAPRARGQAGLAGRTLAGLRRAEQRRAASLGRYAALLQFGHPSGAARRGSAAVLDDLEAALRFFRPREVYTHDLADRHPTHAAVALRVVEAVRRLPRALRPARLVGCEVWRGLDWLAAGDRVELPVAGPEALARARLAPFASQLGVRPYDLGVAGRLRANAVFAPGRVRSGGLGLGMDLGPLLRDDALDPAAFVRGRVESFGAEVTDRLARLSRHKEAKHG